MHPTRPMLAAFMALAVALSGLVVLEAAAPPAAAAVRDITLYGSAADGWGVSSAAGSIHNPGPTLYMEVGDHVTLHLYAADAPDTHNWTLDFNNNSKVDPGEPTSPDFSSATVPVVYNFTVPDRPGTWTYRCGIHTSAMTGFLVILGPPTFTLYGDALKGWGNSSASIATPGPTLVVTQGDSVSLDLYSADAQNHTFLVDWDNNGKYDPGVDAQSPVFRSPTVPLRWNFTATLAGNFTYYCGIHFAPMKGTLEVKAAPSSSMAGYVLYAIVIVAVVIVAVGAAVIVRRRTRTPPPPPPETGP